ncbi:transposase [Gluconobacter cerinus]|uniref:transposase n=1 Tax=Gluconobacter cerinus TaxID=38307 RepID=UPI0039EB5CFF
MPRPPRLNFIDESAVSTKMARLRGWSKRDTRCQMPVPHWHWNTMTFIGGLRLSGMTTPMMLAGSMTGEWFGAYTRQILAPSLTAGDIVILDNLLARRGPRRSRGRRRPPCSSYCLTAAWTSIRSKNIVIQDGNLDQASSAADRRDFTVGRARCHQRRLSKGRSPPASPSQGMSQSDRIIL